MTDVERKLWINDRWDVGRLREASCELIFYTTQVLEPLVELVYNVEPTLDPVKGTEAVKEVFKRENIPVDKRQRWNRSELRLYNFFTSVSIKNTPEVMDYKIQKYRKIADLFGSPRDAYEYWHDILTFQNKRLTAVENGKISSLKAADRAYVESRILRFALEGRYLVSQNTPLVVEN